MTCVSPFATVGRRQRRRRVQPESTRIRARARRNESSKTHQVSFTLLLLLVCVVILGTAEGRLMGHAGRSRQLQDDVQDTATSDSHGSISSPITKIEKKSAMGFAPRMIPKFGDSSVTAHKAPPSDKTSTEEIKKKGEHDLSNLCNMEIKFFEHEGKHPTKKEVESLLFETGRFFTDLFSRDDATQDAFVGFGVTHHVKPLYRNEAPDLFQVDFHSTIQLSSHVEFSDVDRIISAASFEDFIQNYIWFCPPHKVNQFYHTNAVAIHCNDDKDIRN